MRMKRKCSRLREHAQVAQRARVNKRAKMKEMKFNTLPLDILEIVVEFLDKTASSRDLFNAMLSCRTLAPLIVPMLYRQPDLCEYKPLAGLPMQQQDHFPPYAYSNTMHNAPVGNRMLLKPDCDPLVLRGVQRWQLVFRTLAQAAAGETLFAYCSFVSEIKTRSFLTLLECIAGTPFVEQVLGEERLKIARRWTRQQERAEPTTDEVAYEFYSLILPQCTNLKSLFVHARTLLRQSSLVKWVRGKKLLKELKIDDPWFLSASLAKYLPSHGMTITIDDQGTRGFLTLEDQLCAPFWHSLQKDSISTVRLIYAPERPTQQILFSLATSQCGSLKRISLQSLYCTSGWVPSLSNLISTLICLEELEIQQCEYEDDIASELPPVQINRVCTSLSLKTLTVGDFSGLFHFIIWVLKHPNIHLSNLSLSIWMDVCESTVISALACQRGLRTFNFVKPGDYAFSGVYLDEDAQTSLVDTLGKFSKLNSLALGGCEFLEEEHIIAILQEKPDLQELTIDSSEYSLSDVVFPTLKKLRSLRSLTLYESMDDELGNSLDMIPEITFVGMRNFIRSFHGQLELVHISWSLFTAAEVETLNRIIAPGKFEHPFPCEDYYDSDDSGFLGLGLNYLEMYFSDSEDVNYTDMISDDEEDGTDLDDPNYTSTANSAAISGPGTNEDIQAA